MPCLFSPVFFDLYPATALLHLSLKSSNRPDNRFLQDNYHHISFIRAIKSCVLTMLILKICHKDLFLHLQKIVSQPFSANRELTLEGTSTKKLYFHNEKDLLNAVVTTKT